MSAQFLRTGLTGTPLRFAVDCRPDELGPGGEGVGLLGRLPR